MPIRTNNLRPLDFTPEILYDQVNDKGEVQVQLYSYEITVTPTESDFNSKNLRPLPAKVFIRFATSKADAVEQFRTVHFPVLRRNGIVRGIKQAMACMTVRRMTSHKVGA